ncbi:MAG TPA: hypothetical protein PKY12_10625, partial [Catalimonadaceae bacterium]|nr:hypothetical protein [Catalimonadaceae bacterium]
MSSLVSGFSVSVMFHGRTSKVLQLLLWLSMAFTTGCITTPFLKKGEKLLVNQKVKGNKSIPTELLEPIFRQKANRKILGTTPYLGFYFFGKSIWDTSRIKRQIAMKEAYYDAKILALE